ncbi:MAG: YggS family pyridoxal phosphate enzyme [Planctomycetota bacterium]
MPDATVHFELTRFRERYAELRSEVDALAPGVPPRIVLVTKYLDADACATLAAAGFQPFGENRTTDLAAKADFAGPAARWQFIGHLQRNKIAKTLPLIELFHALDSERLAAGIQTWATSNSGRSLACLVEVNLSGETTKGGVSASAALTWLPDWVKRFPQIEFRGLMTMAPELAPNEEPERCRPIFAGLRSLRDRIAAKLPAEAQARFVELSMGMSSDYRVATQEGATLLRLGRILYS